LILPGHKPTSFRHSIGRVTHEAAPALKREVGQQGVTGS
jgi:hypothetical protein